MDSDQCNLFHRITLGLFFPSLKTADDLVTDGLFILSIRDQFIVLLNHPEFFVPKSLPW